MSVNLHHSSNINLDWTINASPTPEKKGKRSPLHVNKADHLRGGGLINEPAVEGITPLREGMLMYLANLQNSAPAAGAVRPSRDLSAGPRGSGNWASVAQQQDIDRGSPLRSAAGRGIRAWDCNPLTKQLTHWGHTGPRSSVTQDEFAPPAYAIIRGGKQAARDISGVDQSPYAQGLDSRPVDSGDGPRRHLESKVDIQEDKSRLTLPQRADNEEYKRVHNRRYNASAMPEAGTRWSSFEGEKGREGTIVDYQGKMHHAEPGERQVRRKAPVHTAGVRIYDPNVATVKVRDWGHEPVTSTVTKDTHFSPAALRYANEQAALRPQAGASFLSRTKNTVRDAGTHATFSGEGPRRHLETQFSTKENPSLTVPDRTDHEQYKAAPGRVDATRLPEAGAKHTALDDKDLELFPLNKQRLAVPKENPGVRLTDQTPGTKLEEWNHAPTRETHAMETFVAPPLPPPPGSHDATRSAGLGKVGAEAPFTRSGLDPHRHLKTQFSNKVDGVRGGVHEGGTVKLEMQKDLAPSQIPQAGSAALSHQRIANDVPSTASRDVPAPAVEVGAAGKVQPKPRQVGPRTNAVFDEFVSQVVIGMDGNPPPPETKPSKRLASGEIAAREYSVHRFEPVQPSRHTYKYRQGATPPQELSPSRQGRSGSNKHGYGAQVSGNSNDREWRTEHTRLDPAAGKAVAPPWGDEEYHVKYNPAATRDNKTFRHTHELKEQEAHLRPDAQKETGLVGKLEPTNPYASSTTEEAREKPVSVRVSDNVRTTLPKNWQGEEVHPSNSPFAASETTGGELGANLNEEDIVRVDPLRSASSLSFGVGTAIPGIGKRPDGANALSADFTSRDQLRFEQSALNPPAQPKVTATMRVSRPLDNPLDTVPDIDSAAPDARTTAQEIAFHGREKMPQDVHARAHLQRGTSIFGTRPDGVVGTPDVHTKDFQRYADRDAATVEAGAAPYETKETDFTTTAQDIAPRTTMQDADEKKAPSKSSNQQTVKTKRAPSTKEVLARLSGKITGSPVPAQRDQNLVPAAGRIVHPGPPTTLPAHASTAISPAGESNMWLATHGNPDAQPEFTLPYNHDQSEAKAWTTTANEVGSTKMAGAARTGGAITDDPADKSHAQKVAARHASENAAGAYEAWHEEQQARRRRRERSPELTEAELQKIEWSVQKAASAASAKVTRSRSRTVQDVSGGGARESESGNSPSPERERSRQVSVPITFGSTQTPSDGHGAQQNRMANTRSYSREQNPRKGKGKGKGKGAPTTGSAAVRSDNSAAKRSVPTPAPTTPRREKEKPLQTVLQPVAQPVAAGAPTRTPAEIKAAAAAVSATKAVTAGALARTGRSSNGHPAGGGPMATAVPGATTPESRGAKPKPKPSSAHRTSTGKTKGRWLHLKFIQKALAVAQTRNTGDEAPGTPTQPKTTSGGRSTSQGNKAVTVNIMPSS